MILPRNLIKEEREALANARDRVLARKLDDFRYALQKAGKTPGEIDRLADKYQAVLEGKR